MSGGNLVSEDDNNGALEHDPSHQSIPPSDKLCLQMNYYDSYVSKPTILDRRRGESLPLSEFKVVPVIRIFGNLPTGHQVLCHVHGVFPYIYIRYDGSNFDSSLVRRQKCALLHTLLESKMKALSKKSRGKDTDNDVEKTENIGHLEYIANVSIVKGVPFYGYHVGWTAFYKISLLNPSHVQVLSDFIRDGKIFQGHRDVYESHIPYLLQFSADFNLFGSEWVQLRRCYFRKPILNDILSIDTLLKTKELEELLKKFCDERNNVLRFDQFRRVGNGLLEIDVLPQFIANKESLHFKDLHHDFTLKLDNKVGEMTASKGKPHIQSTKNMITDITALRSLYSLDEYHPPAEIERYDNLDTTFQSSREFEEFFKKAKVRLSSNSSNDNGSGSSKTPINFETFVNNSKEFDHINTPYSSIDELWPDIPACVDPQMQEDRTSLPGGAIKDGLSTSNVKTPQEMPNVEPIEDLAKAEERMDEDEEDFFSDFEAKMDTNEADDLEEIAMDGNSDDDDEDNGRTTGFSSQSSQDGKNLVKFSSDLELTQTIARRSLVGNHKRMPRSPRNDRRKNPRGLRIANRRGCYVYKRPPFKYKALERHLEMVGNPKINYPDPFFSNPRDLSEKPYVYAGRIFEITSPHLVKRIPLTFQGDPTILEAIPTVNPTECWRYCKKPPTYTEVLESSKVMKSPRIRRFQTQIDKLFRSNKLSYKYPSDVPLRKNKKRKPVHDVMTHFSLEIQTASREDKLPDPLVDEVIMIVWKLDDELYPFDIASRSEGILVVNPNPEDEDFSTWVELASDNIPVAVYDSEFDMFEALTDLVLVLDPDILSGYEVHSSSWGYIIERCLSVHKFSIADELSRVTSFSRNRFKEYWGYRNSSGIIITGRYVLNIWRVLRSSLDLRQYTVENVAYHLLHRRIPQFSHQVLDKMWRDRTNLSFAKTVIKYWLTRVQINIELIRKQEFLEKTMEQARLIGVDFRSIYYRGSQYKVESFLIRICKSEGFILLSPSKRQVRGQKALECVPLVMEPEAAFYKSPLVVLDFQSLYPSIIIAYNYCYSTMLGRVRELNLTKNEVGVSSHHLDIDILKLLEEDITISPNGVVFIKPSVRKSTLVEMLTEILDIRFMVKKTISELGPTDTSLRKLLENKQLGLKLLANVTYGYTSASFSGRMPCSDLADAIVQTGRETLEKAVELVESNPEWGAKVVYGDTDSLFVYLPGKTREDAFRIGHEISIEVTKRNPKPIFLKLEKVYHGCILVSKKRYAGFAYESAQQKEPRFDAKGIETVRRDGYPAQQTIVETALRILFNTLDLSQVKSYIQSQFSKIYSGHVSIQDFCFAKEVKLGTYKSEKSAPPGAIVAIRQKEKDHRAEPQFKERIPYVVVRSKSGELLRNRSLSPSEYLKDETLELDAEYYINKTLVPPLSRLFNIMGINVAEWALDLTRVKRPRVQLGSVKGGAIGDSLLCCSCMKEQLAIPDDMLCEKCSAKPRVTAINLVCKNLTLQKKWRDIMTICRTCNYQYARDAGVTGNLIATMCESYDCPIYYSRIRIGNSCDNYETKRRVAALQKLDTW